MKNILLFTLLYISFSNTSVLPYNTQNKNITSPELAWKFNSTGPYFSSPVISGSTVYAGGSDSVFRAFDIANGDLIFEIKINNGSIRSTPLIINDKIYLNGGDGALYCFSLDGDLLWRSQAGAESKYDFADYHQSSPVYNNGTVYFGLGDGNVCAVDPENGNIKWKFKADGAVHTTPAFDDSRLYFGSFDGHVYAVNISDGSLVWKFKTVGHTYFPLGEVQGSPSVSSGIIYIGARDYNFYAIDCEKGYCRWNKVYKKGWVLTNIIHDTVLYLEGADERILAAVNPVSGKEYWNRNMEFLMFGKPAFSESMLYTGTTIGKVHGIDLTTGNDVWTFLTDGYKANRSKYFKEDDSYRDDIYSIIRSNEQFLEVEMELGGIFSTPAIKDDYIVFACSDGTLYCLKDGS